MTAFGRNEAAKPSPRDTCHAVSRAQPWQTLLFGLQMLRNMPRDSLEYYLKEPVTGDPGQARDT